MNLQNKNRLTDAENKLTFTKGERKGSMRLTDTTIYEIESNKDLLYNTGNNTQMSCNNL